MNMAEKQVAEAVHEGVVLTLSTDGRMYHPGEIVVAEARVENPSSSPKDYVLGYSVTLISGFPRPYQALAPILLLSITDAQPTRAIRLCFPF
ncbi:MAG TPA: hypothetical protein VNO70_17865 [Blastocatellia bacterium]|nr:hypothetical protein [Blastocatellia bacterium]